MLFYILNVFLIVLSTWSSPVSSQNLFQQAIDSLNPCASSCLARSATFIGCDPADFNCQCQKQDAVIGPDRRPSPQGGCIFKDCGPPNATDVRRTFNKICDFIAADKASSSSAAAQAPATLTPVIPPPATITATQVVTQPPATVIQQTTVAPPPFFPPPSPATTLDAVTVTAQGPASLIPIAVTQTQPAVTVTSIPDNTPIQAKPLPQSLESESLALTTTAIASDLPLSTGTPDVLPDSQASTTTTPSTLSSSIALTDTTTSPSATPRKRLPPSAIAGITILVLLSIATLLAFAFVFLRRRKRAAYISNTNNNHIDEKSRPTTDDGVPSPASSTGRGLPWDGRGKNKISSMMGVEIGPRMKGTNDAPLPTPTSPPNDGRPKSRGKGDGANGSGTLGRVAPTSFPMMGMGTGTPQGVNTGSPPGTGNSMRRTGTGGSAGSGAPLKSAMKKPRDGERPKSRPLIVGEGGELKFGFDPLGSNPRSPT